MFGPLLNMKPLSLYADVIPVSFKKSFSPVKNCFLWDILGVREFLVHFHRANSQVRVFNVYSGFFF